MRDRNESLLWMYERMVEIRHYEEIGRAHV